MKETVIVITESVHPLVKYEAAERVYQHAMAHWTDGAVVPPEAVHAANLMEKYSAELEQISGKDVK